MRNACLALWCDPSTGTFFIQYVEDQLHTSDSANLPPTFSSDIYITLFHLVSRILHDFFFCAGGPHMDCVAHLPFDGCDCP